MSEKELSYTVIFELNEAGGYTVTVPSLPGLVTEGRTLAEARDMARDAIQCYLEGMVKEGQPIPTEQQLLHETVKIAMGEA